MSIISQETWDNIPKEEKEKIRQDYQKMLNGKTEFTEEEKNGAIFQMEWLFSKENLQPKPKIRTWEDVNEYYDDEATQCVLGLQCYIAGTIGSDAKIGAKLIATYKIAKLIELGYGGMVTEDEWKEGNHRWVIVCNIDEHQGFMKVTSKINYQAYKKEFIAFHTQQQAEEFMFYPENRALVEQYYMI